VIDVRLAIDDFKDQYRWRRITQAIWRLLRTRGEMLDECVIFKHEFFGFRTSLKTTKSLFPTEARTADINTKALVYRAPARHASFFRYCVSERSTQRMRDAKHGAQDAPMLRMRT
jgi:hypothetical protein